MDYNRKLEEQREHDRKVDRELRNRRIGEEIGGLIDNWWVFAILGAAGAMHHWFG